MSPPTYRNPLPTVDIVIELETPDGERPLVLIQRKNPPLGWALPGGFIDYGESAPDAARREAREETGLDVNLVALLGVYSQPGRDPRHHTMTTVYLARAQGSPRAGDDAGQAQVFEPQCLPSPLCFDHGQILADYLAWRSGARPAAPV